MNVSELNKPYRLNKQVRIFAHDHDPEKHDHGVGTPWHIELVNNEVGDVFVTIICT